MKATSMSSVAAVKNSISSKSLLRAFVAPVINQRRAAIKLGNPRLINTVVHSNSPFPAPFCTPDAAV
jgi:hypothetical protein